MQLELLEEIINETRLYSSGLKISEWYEGKMVMPRGGAFPGPFKYDKTPHLREIVDCFAPDHPMRILTAMGPAQGGKSIAVLNPIIGYTIAQNPCNIMLLTGASELTDKAILKVDFMIDQCGIRYLIKPQTLKARNNRTGDTNKMKEFRGGDFKSGSVTNHNLLRQNDVQIMLVDDFSAARQFEKQTGSTRLLVLGRVKAFEGREKVGFISSPQIKGADNTEDSLNLSDKRLYNIPCPKCHKFIVLQWEVKIDNKESAGMYWKLDNFGRVIPESVGYICQLCGKFFDDTHKYQFLNDGKWEATCIPKELNHYGYQWNGLINGHGFTSWASLCAKRVNCHPPGQARIESDYQTFLNVDMGELYEPPSENIDASNLVKHRRNYHAGTIPETLSIKDGNGKIICLTVAFDLNGKVDDARVDYEVVGHSESGTPYSIWHDSIGTFIPRENTLPQKVDRVKWTYEHGKPNSVWPEVEKVLQRKFPVHSSIAKRLPEMGIGLGVVDTGHFTVHAYTFLDTTNCVVVGVRGDDKYTPLQIDKKTWQVSKERPRDCYIIEVNKVKDELAQKLRLKWDPNDEKQPPGYLNFPLENETQYKYLTYFSHFESEHRVIEGTKTVPKAIWKKKNSSVQNHYWDCRVYNMPARDIYVDRLFTSNKIKGAVWSDYVTFINQALAANQ